MGKAPIPAFPRVRSASAISGPEARVGGTPRSWQSFWSRCPSLQMPPSCRALWLCTLGRGTRWTSPVRCLPTPVPLSRGSEMVSCCPAPTTPTSRSTTPHLPATWRWGGVGAGARCRSRLSVDRLLGTADILSLASLAHPGQWSHSLGKKASLSLPLPLEEPDQGLEGSRVFLPHETPFFLFYFLLKYSWFAMLCPSLLFSTMTQLYTEMHSSLLSSFPL